MIVITGAAGFIGSYLVGTLNEKGISNLVLVDDFSKTEKNNNLENKEYVAKIQRSNFDKWMSDYGDQITCVIHIGARTDTTEFDEAIFEELNIAYSKMIWKHCVRLQIPLVYASSAATYGLGEFGYLDEESKIPSLQPLNPYGWSKQLFDIWALEQTECPPNWVGLKFFNVYGPNEYHKGRMASVIFHTFKQVNENGAMKLFRSHNPEYKDGEQMRDFIYVKDVASVILFLMEGKAKSGIYNLGSGKARTFLDLARSTFNALQKPENISFVDTPIDIRDKYQYFTEASMQKLIDQGYKTPFHTLEQGIEDYVKHFLIPNKYM